MAQVLEFSFSISPSNECSGLISFRIDWLDLLAAQGALKSLLQEKKETKDKILSLCHSEMDSPVGQWLEILSLMNEKELVPTEQP